MSPRTLHPALTGVYWHTCLDYLRRGYDVSLKREHVISILVAGSLPLSTDYTENGSGLDLGMKGPFNSGAEVPSLNFHMLFLLSLSLALCSLDQLLFLGLHSL